MPVYPAVMLHDAERGTQTPPSYMDGPPPSTVGFTPIAIENPAAVEFATARLQTG
jgi:hypothetical protein